MTNPLVYRVHVHEVHEVHLIATANLSECGTELVRESWLIP